MIIQAEYHRELQDRCSYTFHNFVTALKPNGASHFYVAYGLSEIDSMIKILMKLK